MNCQSCGHKNRDSAKFCEECGATLKRTCGQCGNELRPDAKFCDSCGHPVSATAPDSEKQESSKPTPSVSEGERRIVTVLFADAVGHTTISESLDEEEMYNLMQGCFKTMQEVIEKFGGNVNQFTGDGVLALFGAPIAHEDSARRAVMAGLALQESLSEFASEVKKKHPIECSYRVGLNTGPVVVGKISDNLDLEFAAVGDTVNLAARMEGLAESGSVYLSEHTYRAVSDYFECEDLGAKEIKGKSKPVRVYRAVKEIATQSRLDASVRRGLTPYVGRDQELSMLQGYYEKAKRGQGQVVLISGEAGIGKSRTLYEFRKKIASEDILWLGGQCVAFGANIPYVSVIDLLKERFDVQDTDLADEVITKIDAGTASWRSNEKRAIPYIKYLLSVDPGDKAVAQMDPIQRRAGFYEAFRAFVSSLPRDAATVMVIEDLHWVNQQSEEIIQLIVDLVGSSHLLLLLTARPGYQYTLGDRSYFNRMSLSQLPPEEGDRMALEALGEMDLPKQIQELISLKAEGNPFFIEEVVRSLVETGALVNDNGELKVGNIHALKIPDTIHEVILSRIDRLEPAAREAMQLASVIGREFTVRLLNRISDLEDELHDTLDELKSLELIYETGYMPELSYMFKHALTHDVAYSTLLMEHRKRLHRTVAMAIETLFEERLTEHYEALAYHYESAEEWEKAVRYLIKSGKKATATYANTEAVEYFTKALAICERDEALAEIHFTDAAEHRAQVYDALSEYESSIADFDSVIDRYKSSGDRRRQGFVLSMRSFVEWQAHFFNAAEQTSLEVIALAGKDMPDVRFAGIVTLWYNLDVSGRHRDAEPHLAEIKATVNDVDCPFFQALWASLYLLRLNWEGQYDSVEEQAKKLGPHVKITATTMATAEWSRFLALGGKGNYLEAIKGLKELLNMANRMGNIFYAIRIYNSIGWMYGEVHHIEEALKWNTEGMVVAQDAPTLDSEVESNARLNLGDNFVELGRMTEAEEHFKWVDQISRNPSSVDYMSIDNYSAHCFHSYGHWWFIHGDFQKALQYAEDCIEVADRSDRPKNMVKGLRLKGQALQASGKLEESEAVLREALKIAREINNPPQLWKTHEAYGAFLDARDQPEEAKTEYENAVQVLENMAAGLDDSLQEILLKSNPVETLRKRVHG
jgi:class 3 adenylate cyclase/tetratricopeptide (TPR) repeat protein